MNKRIAESKKKNSTGKTNLGPSDLQHCRWLLIAYDRKPARAVVVVVVVHRTLLYGFQDARCPNPEARHAKIKLQAPQGTQEACFFCREPCFLVDHQELSNSHVCNVILVGIDSTGSFRSVGQR